MGICRSAARVLALTLAPALAAAAQEWTAQRSGTKARLRGLAAVSAEVAWASGAQGTVVRTLDGGATWRRCVVPGADGLDFRDLHAEDAQVACVLAIGPGELSRIYRTADGGASWTLAHQNRDPAVFLDAIAFFDPERGLAVGDPVKGQFTVLLTADGGRSWTPRPAEAAPQALEREGAFAASGTCLVAQRGGAAWLATGGAAESRVLRSADFGRTWTAHATPVPAGNASTGLFSLAFRDGLHGVAIGGDYTRPEQPGPWVALTGDGGRTWRAPAGRGPAGYRSAVAYVPAAQRPTLVCVGPAGAEISRDDGESWTGLHARGFNAVAFTASAQVGWAVGDDGTISRLDVRPE